MTWINVGIAAVGVVTSLYGASQARGAASGVRGLGKANAAFIMEENIEERRRLRYRQVRTQKKAGAQIAASGFRSGKESIGGSQKAYVEELTRVQNAEMAWLAKSGRSRAEIARKGGMIEGRRLEAQAVGLYGQALQSGLQGFGAYQSRNA